MKHESFQIKFHWQTTSRELQIRTYEMESQSPFISMYEVFRDNMYLFSIYPTITADACKAWQIVEKERLSHLPPGFVGMLGNMIDNFYINESN